MYPNVRFKGTEETRNGGYVPRIPNCVALLSMPRLHALEVFHNLVARVADSEVSARR